jgi:hypothetical protein
MKLRWLSIARSYEFSERLECLSGIEARNREARQIIESAAVYRGDKPVSWEGLRAFGERVFDIIETTPDRLREIDGIGPVRVASILAATRIPFSYTP